MHWREYPVLPEDDQLFEEFRVCLDDDAARVLAYLVARRESQEIDSPEATRLAIRVGTELGRGATIESLSTLEEHGLVRTTTVSSETRGRPPKGWIAVGDDRTLFRRVRRIYTHRLLVRATEVAAHFETPLPDDWPETLELVDDRTETTADLTVVLNWLPNGLHAPLFVAAECGFYEQLGISVDVETARGSGAALERFTTGTDDVAVIGAASLCRADAPLVPLALLYQRSMAVLYTANCRLSEHLTSVDQLRGRRLAVAPDSEVGTLAQLFLARAGVLDEIEILTTPGEEREALIRGDADVATGMPVDAHELASSTVSNHGWGWQSVTDWKRLQDALRVEMNE